MCVCKKNVFVCKHEWRLEHFVFHKQTVTWTNTDSEAYGQKSVHAIMLFLGTITL